MPLQPPQTPFIPSRYADESLLLTTEPIFGDVTLGDDEDWRVAGPSRLEPPKTVGRDRTLDLESYLPEMEEGLDGDETVRLEECLGTSKEEIRGVEKATHKRGGSQSLTRERELSATKRRELP